MPTETIYLRVSPELKQWLEEQKAMTRKTISALIIEQLELAKKKYERSHKKPLTNDS